jgi:hypothetical protein
MTDQLCSIEIAKAFDRPLTTVFVCAAKLMPEGPATILLLVVLVFCTAALPFVFRYYAGVVGQGAALEGSLERQDYDKLRASLAEGNFAARLYAIWLTGFLDSIERFFGDAGMADRTLFPRAFGLKTPAPLWTAPALDRCLLLALIYPIATIFVIWAISGHVGPAEAALGLSPDVPGLSRALGVAAIGFSSFAFWHAVLTSGWKHLVWFALFLVCGGTGYIVLLETGYGAVLAAPAGAGVVAVAVNRAGARAGARAVAAILTAGVVLIASVVAFDLPLGIQLYAQGAVVVGLLIVFISAFAIIAAGAFAAAGFGAGAGAGAVVAAVTVGASAVVAAGLGFTFAVVVGVATAVRGSWLNRAIKHRGQGVFQSLFLPGMVVACLCAADLLSPLEDYWRRAAPYCCS